MDTDKHGFKTGSSKMKRNAEKQRTRSGAERCSGQPEGLLEISRGLRSAAKIPPVHGETATTLKGSQSRAGVVCGAGTRSGCVILRDGFRGCRSAQPPANFWHRSAMLHDACGTKEWNGNLFGVMKKLIEIRSRVRK